MSDPYSPIIDFYPQDFEMDMNGKKQDWEAIVKIPFIDQDRLQTAMKSMCSARYPSRFYQPSHFTAREGALTAEERARNSMGNSWCCVHDPTATSRIYPSPSPSFLPDLHHCLSSMSPYNLPTLDGLHFVKGLCQGVLLGKDAIAGFPSLNTLPHVGHLGLHHVNVFQAESKNETLVVTLGNVFEDWKSEDVARKLLKEKVYVNYPYLQEALVVGLSDELFSYQFDQNNQVQGIPHEPISSALWQKAGDRIERWYSKKLGTVIGTVDVVVKVKLLKGLKREEDGSMVKDWEDKEVEMALQTIVQEVGSVDPRFIVSFMEGDSFLFPYVWQ
jgi:5'-3' exoribonuclease 1